jgi:hypothetical protein
MSRARLSWSYPLKPSVGSCSYDIRLEAHPYRQAKVIVLSPKLQPDSQGRLPHVYDSGALCLNLAGDWRPNQLFINTTIPWTLEWLFFYELWLSDGVWRGDGLAPGDRRGQEAILHQYTAPRSDPKEKGAGY